MFQQTMISNEQCFHSEHRVSRGQGSLQQAQQALIEAIAQADRLASASALAEMRLALRDAGLPDPSAALHALEALARAVAEEQRGLGDRDLH